MHLTLRLCTTELLAPRHHYMQYGSYGQPHGRALAMGAHGRRWAGTQQLAWSQPTSGIMPVFMRFPPFVSTTESGTAVYPSHYRCSLSERGLPPLSRPGSPGICRKRVGHDAVRSPHGALPYPIPRKMRLAFRGLWLRMPDQATAHRRAHVERQCPRSEGVPQVTWWRTCPGPPSRLRGG